MIKNKLSKQHLNCISFIRFETTIQTLSYESDSMLAAMFNVDSNFSKPGIMRDGAYCLDRDPEVFKVS